MIHTRDDWTVEVSEDEDFRGDHFDTLFDDTFKAGRACKRFVLFDDDRQDSESAILELHIFGAGKVRAYCYQPCLVDVYRRQKVIYIGVFPRATKARR